MVGIGALQELDDGGGEVKSIRTNPYHLRKDIAGMLLAHIATEAKARRLTRLSLETGSGPALELYRKHDFVDGEAFADYRPRAFNQFLHLQLCLSLPANLHPADIMANDDLRAAQANATDSPNRSGLSTRNTFPKRCCSAMHGSMPDPLLARADAALPEAGRLLLEHLHLTSHAQRARRMTSELHSGLTPAVSISLAVREGSGAAYFSLGKGS
ncbi:GNAT family N-acetyltransferase [Bradyrhizobium sp. CB1650]|uniref:GNAT family N-acetyltransferase n=1 Tax=Bradyrhizobium sp. CB1650 TaxID=3039153 RepID=UPI0024349834|nr:GNAT family N-acetyltransferase [Bradyrhizobium sp. CB1650]WGD54840.1 GNAT family N-acetyltransferase [Bradyrhizobium sp. CB1650]